MKLPRLTQTEAHELSRALDRVSAHAGARVSLNSLVQRWFAFVSEVQSGYELTVYDYTNDLTVRDRIEEVLAEVPEALRARIETVVQEADDRFMKATDAVSRPLLPRPHPWWKRVPGKRSPDFGIVVM